jgi:SAM-dependent methyltransferase
MAKPKAIDTKLFNTPRYYDVAFSWDPSSEIAIFEEIFRNHVDFKVLRILEPCCGAGRFLTSLPKHGYHIVGYDNSPEMIEYARMRIEKEGLSELASAEVADMRSARFHTQFDAAINSINSLGYILSDQDIIDHLRSTASDLKKGGVYVTQISMKFRDLSLTRPEKWTRRRNGIKIKAIFQIVSESLDDKICHVKCRMKINDCGKIFELEEEQLMRCWSINDLNDLVLKSEKFKIEAIYSEEKEPVIPDPEISGEDGSLFYVLKRI